MKKAHYDDALDDDSQDDDIEQEEDIEEKVATPTSDKAAIRARRERLAILLEEKWLREEMGDY